jgi:hypothetical protein
MLITPSTTLLANLGRIGVPFGFECAKYRYAAELKL